MHEPRFYERLKSLGISGLLLSFDTLASIFSFGILLYHFDAQMPKPTADPLLSAFTLVSASLFAIVLTGFTIITSFSDKRFIYAWKRLGEFDNIVTTFQYNLYLPIIVIISSLTVNHILYNGFAAIVVVTFFVYMVVSLADLVNLISKYAIQRGEFIRQLVEGELETPDAEYEDRLTTEELKIIKDLLKEQEES